MFCQRWRSESPGALREEAEGLLVESDVVMRKGIIRCSKLCGIDVRRCSTTMGMVAEPAISPWDRNRSALFNYHCNGFNCNHCSSKLSTSKANKVCTGCAGLSRPLNNNNNNNLFNCSEIFYN